MFMTRAMHHDQETCVHRQSLLMAAYSFISIEIINLYSCFYKRLHRYFVSPRVIKHTLVVNWGLLKRL